MVMCIRMIYGLATVFLLTQGFNLASVQGADPEVREILRTWQRHYEASIENIDNFIVVRDDQTVYYKKAYDNGRPYFESRVEDRKEEELASGSNLTDSDVFSRAHKTLLEQGVYKGLDEVGDYEVHVIYVDKAENLVEEPWAPEKLEDVYLRIDPEKWVVRELEYKMRVKHEGEERIIHQILQHRDYRNVEGMDVSYETSIIIRGLALTEEERREAEEGIAEAERELENLPEAQRRMMEQMFGDQLEKFKQMLEEDQYETKSRVKEVRVNTGLE